MTDSQEQPQSAPIPTVLGEFVEVVVRVPIDRSDAAEPVWGIPVGASHEDIVAYLREAYRTLPGFVADTWDMEGTVNAVRLRANDPSVPHGLRDEMVEVWSVDAE